MDFQIRPATSDLDFNAARQLFEEYAASLDFDLCFQGFKEELDSIKIQYNKPDGILLLACSQEDIVGCVGLRKIDSGIAELKRMYVRPDFRGNDIGRMLLTEAIKSAGELGYEKIRLDTLKTMQKARKLYQVAGFYEIEPYRYNPIEGAVYMEKIIQNNQ